MKKHEHDSFDQFTPSVTNEGESPIDFMAYKKRHPPTSTSKSCRADEEFTGLLILMPSNINQEGFDPHDFDPPTAA